MSFKIQKSFKKQQQPLYEAFFINGFSEKQNVSRNFWRSASERTVSGSRKSTNTSALLKWICSRERTTSAGKHSGLGTSTLSECRSDFKLFSHRYDKVRALVFENSSYLKRVIFEIYLIWKYWNFYFSGEQDSTITTICSFTNLKSKCFETYWISATSGRLRDSWRSLGCVGAYRHFEGKLVYTFLFNRLTHSWKNDLFWFLNACDKMWNLFGFQNYFQRLAGMEKDDYSFYHTDKIVELRYAQIYEQFRKIFFEVFFILFEEKLAQILGVRWRR